ncbi:hypothetical protein C4565_07540 [Candidatus Parcubacteria bacterium]|jgi:hypothetical protein|nr:MAG: hypothetical protein C4565_07540 [Candidatus Parcubacteria bacterium]
MKRFLILTIGLCLLPLVVSASIFFGDTDIQSDASGLGFNKTSGYNINIGNGDLFISRGNGYIGIGTLVPTYPLHVVGSAVFSTSTGAGSPTAASNAATKGYVDSILGGGVGSGSANQTLHNNGSGWVASSLIINNGGAVGIGISPTIKFDVYNSAPSGNIVTYFQSGSTAGTLNLIGSDASWNFGTTASGLQFYNRNNLQYRMTMANSGNIGIGTTTPSSLLDVAGTGSFSTLSVGTPTAANNAATKGYVDSLVGSVWTATSTSLYSGNSGNVGIGITNPTTKLEVVGKVRATGIQIGTSTTAGYALTTDASGVGTWQVLPGTSGSKPGSAILTLHSSIGDPKTFAFESRTSAISTYFTCPTGYSLWSHGNAYWYGDESGNPSYFGTCYQNSLIDDVFTWKAYSSPASVTCPSGYTTWTNASYPGKGIYSTYNGYNGACYKGSPSSFTWETYTGSGDPTTFISCPSGYTAWYHANAQWYSSTGGYYNYTGSCYNASASTDVFKWKSTSPASVTCPSGYTKWYPTNYAYGPGSVTYYTGVCYKGSPSSLPWEIYTGYAPTTVTCPSGYTNWYDTTYAKYYTYSSSYQSYNGYCVNSSATAADAFPYFSTSGSDAVACPSGYTKWQGNSSYYTYRGSGQAAYSSACYKIPAATCQSCPTGWTAGSCNTVSGSLGDYGERVCYKQGGPIQTITVQKKGSNQSISCPAGLSSAGTTANVNGNTERACYVACSSFSLPLTPTSLTGSLSGISVALSWTAPSATECTATDTYNIYRSLTSGSGYSLIASGVEATTFTDATTTQNTTYYYKVSGTNIAGEGSTSNEFSVTTPNVLYSFTTHTFTNCSQTGRTGPTISACRSAYSTSWDENSSFFDVATGTQKWTVPETGVYTIAAYGAQGGSMSYTGGFGAKMQGDVYLRMGEVISILVGQQGSPANNGVQYNGGNGGGGGTFVVDSNNLPIIVAGGGGGAPGTNGGGSASGGQTTINGTAGQSSGGGAGGTNGMGGGRANYSGGGAGWRTDGTTNVDGGGSSAWYDYGGSKFLNGGYGGDNGASVWSGWGGNVGGFGGGGAGGLTAGGGGGYSGGGAGGSWGSTYGGGGGGSYNDGINQSNIAGNRSGAGQVVVTKCTSAVSQAPAVPSSATSTAGNNSVALSWSRGISCTAIPSYFKIFRSLTSGSGFSLYATSTGNYYLDTGVTNGTTYYYKISAINGFGESTQTAEFGAIPAAPALTLFKQGYNSIPPLLYGSNPCEYGIYCSSVTDNGDQEICVDAQFTRLASWSNPQHKLIARMMNSEWDSNVLTQIRQQLGYSSCTVANSGVSYAAYHSIGNGVWGSQPNGYAIGSGTAIDCAWSTSSNVTLYDGQSGNWSFGSQPTQCAAAPTPPSGYLSECNNQNSTDYAVNITCTR